MSKIDSIIDEDTRITAAKLNSETAVASWKELEIFFARGQILVVSNDHDLIEAALAVHLDRKQDIEQMLRLQTLKQPDPDWVKNNCTADTPFWAVVVAPFVLVQMKNGN